MIFYRARYSLYGSEQYDNHLGRLQPILKGFFTLFLYETNISIMDLRQPQFLLKSTRKEYAKNFPANSCLPFFKSCIGY